MKTIKRLVAAIGVFCLSSSAFALNIVPGDADFQGSLPKNPGAADTYCIVNGGTYDTKGTPRANDDEWVGCNPDDSDLHTLYKANVGTPDAPATVEEGYFADDYTTKFFNTSFQPQDATISHDGPDTITCDASDPCYLVVKDGNQAPIWYVFDITSTWNGKDDIVMTGFWPGQGSISHVAIYGGDMPVPEPGTLALLGLGFLGMGLMRRRRTS